MFVISSKVEVEDADFVACEATKDGGAIHATDVHKDIDEQQTGNPSPDLTVAGASFTSCSGKWGEGGGVYLAKAKAAVSETSFTKCSSELKYGGGMFIGGVSTAV